MSFPRYPKYKDSGVEWLGEVPEHWDVISIKWLSPVKRGASPRPIDDAKYFNDEGEFSWVRIADVSACDGVLRETTQKLSTLGSSLSVKIAPGELFVSIAGTVGKPCLSAIKACIHDGFVYFPTLKIDPHFLYRIFEAGVCYGGLGKWGTQLNLNTDTIGSIRIALPPADELKGLLVFLDQETARIDALVAEQQRLMELLKEKRQAVISHAVTKGLNPKAAMKSSGIEYLGDVPAHWDVKPLRYLGRCQNGLNIDGDAFGSGFPFVSYGDVYRSRVLPLSPSGLVESSELDREKFSVERGDVFFTRTSETIDEIGIASICLSTIPNATFAGFLIRFRPEGALDCSFSKHYFSNPRIGSFFAGEMNLVTRASLSQDLLKGLSVLLPPESEQVAIGAFLDDRIDTFEHLAAEAQRAIELLVRILTLSLI